MKRQLAILILMGVCGLTAGTAAVAGTLPEPAAPVAPDPDGVESTAAATVAPRAPESLTPCQQAIRALLDREAAQLAELEARVPAAADAAAFLALQREIEQVKQDTELQVMRTQAQHARLEGRVEQAEQIEAALAEMAAPRPAIVPVERHDEALRGDAAPR
ncbi:MAG: hypothetical protein Q7W56_10985 [Candidatus Latescibacteria bacterium]|nr:hypothetical protein [Candidatus Latescibacterota bacterium]